MSRRHRSQSHDQRPGYSGAPYYGAESPNLSSSGFESFAALSNPSLYEETPPLSASGHTQLPYHHPQSPGAAPFYPRYTEPYYSQSRPPGARHEASYVTVSAQDAYWHRNPASQEDTTPLPSPPLLSANSLNLPPLFTPGLALQQTPSLDPLYNYPAPAEIPYAESAASAASSTLSQPEDDESSKAPADDEKRRRNLAASARFRQKKKIREQQLERQTKDLSDRADELEQRISDLEKENEFLKKLLTEKEADMTQDDKQRFHEFAEMMEKGDL